MIPKRATDLAIEGGWTPVEWEDLVVLLPRSFGRAGLEPWVESYIVLDPTFWQALSKALGWGEGKYATRVERRTRAYPMAVFPQSDVFIFSQYATRDIFDVWRFNAHRLYDLILTGGDTEKFWEEILK